MTAGSGRPQAVSRGLPPRPGPTDREIRLGKRADPDDDPQAVVVTRPEPAEPTPRKQRTTTNDILDAIRAIPDAVAAKVEGKEPVTGGGPRQVTFAPEPELEPDDEPDPDDTPPPPEPIVQRPKFRHPSRSRRRVEIGT
jgi:hypothetical protein